MRYDLRLIVAALGASILAAGCVGGNSRLVPGTAFDVLPAPNPVSARTSASDPLLYIATSGSTSTVTIFDRKVQRVIGQLGCDAIDACNDYPIGVPQVDAQQNLYVPTASGVSVFGRGQTTVSKVFSIPFAGGVAIGTDGTVYVATGYSGVLSTVGIPLGGGTGSIVIYRPGSATPSATVPLDAGVVGIAIDGSNNVYAITQSGNYWGGSGTPPAPGHVYEVPHGSTTPIALFQGATAYFTAVAVDASGNLDLTIARVIANQFMGVQLQVYSPGDTDINTYTLPHLLGEEFTFDTTGKNAYGTYYGCFYLCSIASLGGANLYQYAYPGGGQLKAWSYTKRLRMPSQRSLNNDGMAYSPPLVPGTWDTTNTRSRHNHRLQRGN